MKFETTEVLPECLS